MLYMFLVSGLRRETSSELGFCRQTLQFSLKMFEVIVKLMEDI